MKPPNFSWTPSFDLVAQLAHYGWGGYVVAKSAQHGHPLFGLVGILVYAAIKEFVFDYFVEKASMKDNARDFAFYALGAIQSYIW